MKSELLKFYSRKDIQEEIFNCAKNKEFSIRSGDNFGKRPDTLEFPNDIIEFIKSGATSFHLSEEHWSNPLQLKSGMSQKQLDELRIGWDLIIDIDCKFWDYAKYIAFLIIKALKSHGVKAIGAKFSGSKGFHISVPFEAFPKTINNQKITDLFPEAPKRITQYLMDYIDSEKTDYELSNYILQNITERELIKYFTEKGKSATKVMCKRCKKQGEKIITENEFICPNCNFTLKENFITKYKTCPKCKKLMARPKTKDFKCKYCNSAEYIEKFDMNALMDIDTLLISSRHLYRAPYSHHEKSGLISVPIEPDTILEFEKKQAKIENISEVKSFFKKPQSGEAKGLLIQAFDHLPTIVIEEEPKKDFKIPSTALPEKDFPPSINYILKGLKDGKKRAVFILINFLRCVGWDLDSIEKILKEWNEKNDPPLKWGYIKAQLSYQKRQKEALPPPNYDNKAYYADMGIQVSPEELRFKNPVRYALSKIKGKK